MVRGRKRDLTVPATRQLNLQRDYRARKARYLSELEQRCSKAEKENARLRRELELAQAAIPFASPQEIVQVSSELVRDLANASASIARFQEITAPRASPSPSNNISFHGRQLPTSSYSQPFSGLSSHRPPPFPCKVPSQPTTLPTLQAQTLPNQIVSPIYGQLVHSNTSSSTSPQPSEQSSSLSLGSECCGGYLDCTELVEEEEDEDQGDEDSGSNSHFTHTSKLRTQSR